MIRRLAYRACLAVFMPALLIGCVTPEPPLYRWGSYEDIIYTGYRDPGSSDPVSDGALIEEDIQRTLAEGAAIPPGVRVHLGYLYFSQGRPDEALALFEEERATFPESAVFVDGLIDRLGAR